VGIPQGRLPTSFRRQAPELTAERERERERERETVLGEGRCAEWDDGIGDVASKMGATGLREEWSGLTAGDGGVS